MTVSSTSLPASWAAVLARCGGAALLALLVVATGCDTTEPDTTPPAAPSDLSATTSESSVQLQWSAPPDDDVAGYNIYRGTGGSVDLTTDARRTSAPIDATNFTDNDVTSETNYTYRVTAVDDSENESTGSDAASINFDITPPGAPANLSATSAASSAELEWTAPSDEDVEGYNIYRSTDGAPDPSAGTPVNASPVAGTSFTDADLTNGITYTYRITAVDDGENESTGSDATSVTPFDDPPDRP